MFDTDGLMGFAGYRNMVIENVIDECLEAARNGETSITIDRGDITEDEEKYIQSELERRIKNGNY